MYRVATRDAPRLFVAPRPVLPIGRAVTPGPCLCTVPGHCPGRNSRGHPGRRHTFPRTDSYQLKLTLPKKSKHMRRRCTPAARLAPSRQVYLGMRKVALPTAPWPPRCGFSLRIGGSLAHTHLKRVQGSVPFDPYNTWYEVKVFLLLNSKDLYS